MLNAGRLPTYLLIQEAARRYGVTLAELEAAVERGLVRAVAAPNGGDAPQILVAEDDVALLSDLESVPELPTFDDLPRYHPLANVLYRYRHKPEALTTSIQHGRMKVVAGDAGVLVVEQKKRRRRSSKMKKKKKQPIEQTGKRRKQAEEEARRIREKYKHLEGQIIGIAEAGRKYGVPHPTISRWVKKGFIRIKGQDGQKMLVDESDVAYCAEVYNSRRGQGKWVFDKNGLPYIPKQ